MASEFAEFYANVDRLCRQYSKTAGTTVAVENKVYWLFSVIKSMLKHNADRFEEAFLDYLESTAENMVEDDHPKSVDWEKLAMRYGR